MGINFPNLSNVVKAVETDAKEAARTVGNDVVSAGKAVEKGAVTAGDDFINAGGAAIGYAEMLGLKYPVSAYQTKVDDHLTRGSRVDAAGIDDLHNQGYKGIINLCAENNNDAAPAKSVGMNALHLNIIDNTAPTEQQMKQLLDFVTNPANEPCYVHCEAGTGRTGVAVACYRMAVEGWTPAAALTEAKQSGMVMPDQETFVQRFGADLAAGKIQGYPEA